MTDEKPARPQLRVFISYSRQDADAADWLAKSCTRLGAEIWLDHWSIRPGDNWREKTDEAIDRSNVFLILVSDSKKSDSPWQSSEWSYICENAWARPEVRVIPILVSGSETPAFLKGLEALDGSNKSKLSRCVEYIWDYPSVRAIPETLTEEQRSEVEKRFRDLLDALAETTSQPSDPEPSDTQS
jgi:hypothetical protein